MEQPFIQNLFAQRIGGKDYGKSDVIYKFEKIKRAKLAALTANPHTSLIDLGIGEPDSSAEPQIIQTLYEEAINPHNRGYADNGCVEFKEAAARFMQQVFGVSLDPSTQIMHSIGAKAALSILPACFINPADVVLMTTPGYPVFGTHARYYGGEVYNLPLEESNNYLPDLTSIPKDILGRAKILVLNYPNNPTGASATLKFYEEIVAWAKAHSIIVIQDAAYSALTFADEKPLSILQVPGANDVAIELHSLSKSFNMTGWRMGWICGNPLIVKAYGDVKDNTDSGQFLAVQKAAAKALDNPDIVKKTASKYFRRMDLLVKALKNVGLDVTKPKAGFFLYCKSPKRATTASSKEEFKTAQDFTQWLIHAELISTVPWDDVSPSVRFSVTFEATTEAEENRVIHEIENRLKKYTFEF